ncbi:MAG TPA: GNAT family N-acetyltransferase [Oscillatoriaceae cyanobacterium]
MAAAVSAPAVPVRRLVEDDFAAQDALRLAFDAEEGLPTQGSEAQRRIAFLEKVRAERWWGHFEGDRLVAMACLNTGVADVGQVGGVYTVPERRRRGYSKAVMRQLIADSRERQGMKTLSLFTGETNHPAQAMYRGLGFEQIGECGMIFGKPAMQA